MGYGKKGGKTGREARVKDRVGTGSPPPAREPSGARARVGWDPSLRLTPRSPLGAKDSGPRVGSSRLLQHSNPLCLRRDVKERPPHCG